MNSEVLEVRGEFILALYQLQWSFGPSSGPGGQHANRAHTRASLELDLETCVGPSDAQRERLMAKFGPILRVSVEDTRSQARNRSIALERLEAKLAGALVRQRSRRKTKPGRRAVQRRLDGKRRQSEKKRDRKSPGADG